MSPCHCQCQQDQDTVLQSKRDVNYTLAITETITYTCLCNNMLGHAQIRHAASSHIRTVLTPASWCCRLKCCRVAIHCSCACCHCISDQFKAGIAGVGSSVTNGVASECHHAIVNVNRIRTQRFEQEITVNVH